MCNTLKTLTRQTRNRAKGKGNKNPDKMLRNIDPGIAKVCKLFNKLRKTKTIALYNYKHGEIIFKV